MLLAKRVSVGAALASAQDVAAGAASSTPTVQWFIESANNIMNR
jgi:hypothetical protein